MLSKTAMAALLLLTGPVWAQEHATPIPSPVPYSRDTPIETLAADPAAVAILNKDLPGLLRDPDYPVFKHMSLKAIQDASGGDLSAADVDKTVADLQALTPH